MMRRFRLLGLVALVSAFLGFVAGRSVVPVAPPVERAAVDAPAVPSAVAVPVASGIAVVALPRPPVVAAKAVKPSGVAALNFMRTRIQTSGTQAQACLVFSAEIAQNGNARPADFIRISPQTELAVQTSGNEICLGGLRFGTQYSLTVLQGLRAANGARSLADETLPLSLGDLPADSDFADNGFILPHDAAGGLPIATVNKDQVHVRVDRITDRLLVRTQLGKNYEDNNFYDEGGGNSDTLGVPVWEGDLAVAHAERNARQITAFPVAGLLKPRLPGAYRISLVEKDDKGREQFYKDKFRWIFETDLMLTTHRGADGLHVFVRSLASAAPLGGVRLSLLAINTDVLGEGTSNANGEVVFAAGLMRGVHGHAPRMVMAYRGDDFTALDLDKAAFDFSDRGVDGRDDPGPVDGFIYTDRGIYRPGGVIDASLLLRGPLAEPLPVGQVATLVLRRPDGVEAGRWRLEVNPEGVAIQLISLKPTSPRGTWHLEAMLAGTTSVVAGLDIQVQDFVPNRLAVALDVKSPRIGVDAPGVIAVNSRYLYGAPSPDLQVSAHVQVKRDLDPVGLPGWLFGPAVENSNFQSVDITAPATDAQGHSNIEVNLAALKLPQTRMALRADITVSVAEPGGRATESQTVLKIANAALKLGLCPPNAAGSLDEGRSSAVGVAAFAADGSRVAQHVAFRLIEQVTDYRYFHEYGRWQWKVVTTDRPVTFGTVAVAATGDDSINLPGLHWGTYRLEVNDAAESAFTSIILHVGFVPVDEDAASPEKVGVGLVGAPPSPGGVARLHVKPPFAGQMLLTVENSRVLAVQTAAIPAEGAEISVPVTQGWGPGAYVMASVYRPAAQAKGHAPVRASGLAYVKVDDQPRTISISLTAPPVLRPRTHFDLPVKVAGDAVRGPTWITVAAVDEGILQLTRFASPNPNAHYFGKRKLAVDVRDDYAHLIDGNGAAPGAIRAGGDLDGAGLSVVPTKTTALFSGLVAVGADGTARIPLDLPDFTGGLRIMAVAVSGVGFGHADVLTPVRDPVVAQISLPRFLAPQDSARMTLLAHNVEAPAGLYHVHVVTSGALVGRATDDDISLAAHQALVKSYDLKAGSPGIGQVVLTITGPGKFNVTHALEIEVRSAFQPVNLVARASQGAGEDYVFNPSAAASLEKQGATVAVSYSATGAIELPELLKALDEYPYGCSEQLVSRAMPMLYVPDAASASLQLSPADLRARVQDAIDKLLERQDESGAFGLWRAHDGLAEPYLGGLIVDFLSRAKAHGYTVPQAAIDQGLRALDALDDNEWMLHRYWFYWAGARWDYRDNALEWPGKTYALLLQARAGKANLGDVRYMLDTNLSKLEALSQAQLAVALALAGDMARSATAFDAAERSLSLEEDGLQYRFADFYRTKLRDTAALLSLAAEINDRPRVERLSALISHMENVPEQLTTQEQGWLVIAAGVLLEKAGPVSISVDRVAQKAAGLVTWQRQIAALRQPVDLRNTGSGPVFRVVTLHGLPLDAPAADENVLSIKKEITDPNGNAVDLSKLHQNSRLVIHLSGQSADAAYHQAMLVDPLPAGFEIERIVQPSTENNPNGLPWLGTLSRTKMAEKRDDRFIAALDFNRAEYDYASNSWANNQEFNVAYVVRVVSPGSFTLPAASIADMYRADVQARGAVGRVTIGAP